MDINLTIKCREMENQSDNVPEITVFTTKPAKPRGRTGFKVRRAGKGKMEISGIVLHVMESIRIYNYFA